MNHSWRKVLGSCGFAMALGISAVYALNGYRSAMPVLLVASIAAIALYFEHSPTPPRLFVPARNDVLAVAILLLIMAPIYWWRLYSTPWQVNTDEVSIMVMTRRMLEAPQLDLLGVSGYMGFPAAAFAFVGTLANSLGGIDLYHSRIVHSSLGVGCVMGAYGFYRQFADPLRAGTFAVVLGSNHALFAISRMAMRDNTALLLELIALGLFARGLLRQSKAEVFLAGATTGLAFYAYFPGRIAVVIVMGVLCCIPFLRHNTESLKAAGRYAAILLLGWSLVAAPVMISSRVNPASSLAYARQQFLFYPEGRKLQQEWIRETTPEAAWKANIRNGLTTFNSRLHDQGYIYPNYRHGFVDPATGVLLWAGLLMAAVSAVRRRAHLLSASDEGATALADLIAVVGFLALYLPLAFLITKAPNYTRLLVILPFVSYLAGTALWRTFHWLARRLGGRHARARGFEVGGVACGAVLVIALWNVKIFNDFATLGRKEGNDVGSTARYVEARKNNANHTWVLAADKNNPYYSWGEAWQWQDWVGFFAGPHQTMRVATIDELGALDLPGAFTVFISRSAWEFGGAAFRARQQYVVKPVTPDARLLAVEIQRKR